MVFVLRSSPKPTPINYSSLLKKQNRITPVYLTWNLWNSFPNISWTFNNLWFPYNTNWKSKEAEKKNKGRSPVTRILIFLRAYVMSLNNGKQNWVESISQTCNIDSNVRLKVSDFGLCPVIEYCHQHLKGPHGTWCTWEGLRGVQMYPSYIVSDKVALASATPTSAAYIQPACRLRNCPGVTPAY